MAVGVEDQFAKVASKIEGALLFHTTSEAMPDQQSSLPSASALAVNVPSFPDSTGHVNFESSVPPQVHPIKKRKDSKTKSPAELRRSSSTPHMRNLALASSGELSPTADKRRNKLGYHRTSVACGHCRRRKIRCLVAEGEPTGRCKNCIRLKKECNFFPVDQPPDQPLSQSNSVIEGGTALNETSATSSPRHPAGETIDGFRTPCFAGSASQTPTSRFAIQTDVELDPRENPITGGLPIQHPPYAYPPPIETQWQAPGYLPSATVTDASPSSAGYWRPSPTASSSAYGSESTVSGGQTPSTISSASNMPYGRPGEPQNWTQPNVAPPTRSMSYGNLEGLPQQYSNPALGVQQHDYSRRISPYPFPIDTDQSSMHPASLDSATAAPLSAPILPNQQVPYQQMWNQYNVPTPAHDIQGRSMSAPWYNERGRLDRVQEEHAVQPPVLYSQNNIPQFYSQS